MTDESTDDSPPTASDTPTPDGSPSSKAAFAGHAEGPAEPLAHEDVTADDADGSGDPTAGAPDDELTDTAADAQAAIDEARQRVAEVPADVVVTNHVMGLYELAAIHLSSAPPDLAAAALAIDAVACLVEGLGDRLGREASTMRDALANIRMAFVQVKGASAGPATAGPAS
ncbi:hypothetical protein BH24ACT5_BH24ACT5_22250 [soil metagenome]